MNNNIHSIRRCVAVIIIIIALQFVKKKHCRTIHYCEEVLVFFPEKVKFKNYTSINLFRHNFIINAKNPKEIWSWCQCILKIVRKKHDEVRNSQNYIQVVDSI